MGKDEKPQHPDNRCRVDDSGNDVQDKSGALEHRDAALAAGYTVRGRPKDGKTK